MKFQVDILSGSKVTEGDGQTTRPPDHQTTRPPDRQTLRFLEIHAGSKNYGCEKKSTPGDKIYPMY